MGVDRPECGAGRDSPAKKVVEYEHWHEIKRKCRSLGCGLQFGGAENGLLAIRLQSSKTLFSAARTSNSRCLVLWSKGAMRVSFYFERGCPEQRPRAALEPQDPHSSGPWTPGAPTEVLASRGVVLVESWQVASCRSSYLCSRGGGPHTSPTPGTS
jgi:hypothetical protein